MSHEEIKGYVKANHYFQIEIGSKVFVKIVKDKFFSVDFGRLAVCEIMDLGERVNWKGCIDEAKTQQSLRTYMELLK